MLDVFLLVVTIICGLISIIVDIYIMAIYSHKQQSNLSIIVILCKGLIVFTLLQIQLQPLMLIFDVINARNAGPNLTILWIVLYAAMLLNLAVFKPLLGSMYQTDQDDACWKRILWVIVQLIISIAVFGCFLGLGWLFWGWVYLPVEIISQDADNNGIQALKMSARSLQTIPIQVTLPCFLIGMLCLLGYPILVCCGACGLTALPLSLILQFKNRPKWRRTSQAKLITKSLKQQTVRLIKQADGLKRSLNRIQYVDGWFAKRRKKNQIEQNLKQIQVQLQHHQDIYQLFKLQLEMQNTNPLIYFGKLILGILCLVASLMLWIQIVLVQLVFKGKGTIFLDKIFTFFEDNNANFMSIALLMLLVTFLTCSMIKGTFFFSNNFPFFTVHPMIPGKTWLNSFLFQLSLCLLGSCSLLHLLITTFPQYLRGGEIALMMGSIMQGMQFIGVFIRQKVFIYCYIIMTGIGGVFVAYRMCCVNQFRTDTQKMIEQKRQKMFGKDNKDKPIMIQMTQMNLKDKTPQKNKKNKKIKLTPI